MATSHYGSCKTALKQHVRASLPRANLVAKRQGIPMVPFRPPNAHSQAQNRLGYAKVWTATAIHGAKIRIRFAHLPNTWTLHLTDLHARLVRAKHPKKVPIARNNLHLHAKTHSLLPSASFILFSRSCVFFGLVFTDSWRFSFGASWTASDPASQSCSLSQVPKQTRLGVSGWLGAWLGSFHSANAILRDLAA